ncbi:hypothetical protein R3P38DRAFT_3187671 [Favolaschia claudopus]|uniref:Cellobiose dehydrogenase cytochrome domain-containing protein n=1 Tax=Favolaschia claudopus TaxID=2862362 RepID=A0AAW0C0M7_9AGAR
MQSTVLNITVGFALPPEHSEVFKDELLVLAVGNFSFPLPYGFSAVTLGSDAANAHLASDKGALSNGITGLVWYIVAVNDTEKLPVSIENCRSEVVAIGANQTFTPVIPAPIFVTFSPLTTWDNDRALFIFRCQNCSAVTEYLTGHDDAVLTAILSTSYPIYLDSTLTLANLSLVGAEYEEFKVNTDAAQFANYSSLLQAAKLD